MFVIIRWSQCWCIGTCILGIPWRVCLSWTSRSRIGCHRDCHLYCQRRISSPWIDSFSHRLWGKHSQRLDWSWWPGQDYHEREWWNTRCRKAFCIDTSFGRLWSIRPVFSSSGRWNFCNQWIQRTQSVFCTSTHWWWQDFWVQGKKVTKFFLKSAKVFWAKKANLDTIPAF